MSGPFAELPPNACDKKCSVGGCEEYCGRGAKGHEKAHLCFSHLHPVKKKEKK